MDKKNPLAEHISNRFLRHHAHVHVDTSRGKIGAMMMDRVRFLNNDEGFPLCGHGPAGRCFVESSRNEDPPIHAMTGLGARHQSKGKEIKGFPLCGHGPASRSFVEPSRN